MWLFLAQGYGSNAHQEKSRKIERHLRAAVEPEGGHSRERSNGLND